MGKEAWLELIFFLNSKRSVYLSFNGIRRTTVGRIPDAVFEIGIDLVFGGFRLFILIPDKNVGTTGNTKPTTDAQILIDMNIHNYQPLCLNLLLLFQIAMRLFFFGKISMLREIEVDRQ
jgi:hypothetical protein